MGSKQCIKKIFVVCVILSFNMRVQLLKLSARDLHALQVLSKRLLYSVQNQLVDLLWAVSHAQSSLSIVKARSELKHDVSPSNSAQNLNSSSYIGKNPWAGTAQGF